MAEILETDPDFYLMPAAKQRKIIMDKVAALKTELDAAMPAIDLGGLEPGASADNAPDVLGKVPLALQQLALARQRAVDSGDTALASQLGAKISELLTKI